MSNNPWGPLDPDLKWLGLTSLAFFVLFLPLAF